MTLTCRRNYLILFKVIKIPLIHLEAQNLDIFPVLCLFSMSLIRNSISQWATLFVMLKQNTNLSAPAPGEPLAASKFIFTQKIIINLPKPPKHLLHTKKSGYAKEYRTILELSSIWKWFPNNLLHLGHFHLKFLGLDSSNMQIYNEI